MALKKSQLYSSLWSSCDELRGGMDASQYKDYVLTLLFMKYVSDKYAGKPDAIIEAPAGGSFADMVKLRGDKEIGDKINKIISNLAEANDLKGVIDQADFNDEAKLGRGKEMQDRLSKLVAIFDGLDFRANRVEGDDLLGDAYEYLMRNFATESGKSKGQFYTPAEVSRVMAKVVGIGPDTRPDQTIYDPTCGSGSLLLKAADEAPRGISIYGQEMDNATWALARMNMILHGYPTAVLWRGNTLADPYFKNPDGSLRTFDFAVANPPFSAKAWSNGLNPYEDQFKRFEYGVPPDKNGDYAFLLHLIASLKSKGKGAIILPHGVLFRGNKEADIRRNLVRRGLIKGIIGLPANLFYGTGIPACIVVIDKENAHVRTGIFMIDASKGFMKDGNKNRLRAQDIHKIVDVFNRQIELPGYSRMAPVAEIASPANDYNLNIPRYIDSSEPEDLHDLVAHLNGGIPNRDIDALDAYWAVFPALRDELFQSNGRPGYSEPKVESQQIKATILNHPEFYAYKQRVAGVFDAWRQAHEPQLKGITINAIPKEIIQALSEDLLERFANLPLLNRYDVYQRLMDYWADVMQDDVYLIAADGWAEAARPRGIIEDNAKKIKEAPDLVIGGKKYKLDLIPPYLIVARYFADRQANIDALQAKQEAAARALEEFIDEYTGEEGLLEDAINEKGKVTKGSVKARLKQLKTDNGQLTIEADDADEIAVLEQCLALIDAEAGAAKAVKDAQAKLDAEVLEKYATLSTAEGEIKTLVIDDKWLTAIQTAIVDRYFTTELAAITSEVQRLTQGLANRVKELEERYARPLSELEQEVDALTAKVEAHLKKMGLVWGSEWRMES
ncbi:MAG: N-6 DNA methylase [Chloroflexales bacterium]|nr:N-6 DNA methylase [Chloroflexales bacterium]